AKAEQLIRGLYKAEFEKIKANPAAGKELAETLLKEAKETKEEALRFASLTFARDLAAAAGDNAAALAAIEELAQGFDVNVAGMKARVFREAAKGVKDKEAATTLVEAILEMLPQALDADDYDSAEKLVDAATAAAVQAKSLTLTSRVKKA